jgi:hypothetical protein
MALALTFGSVALAWGFALLTATLKDDEEI